MALYLIGTPIGNLKDMTERAKDILASVPFVLVEKWSDSMKLFKSYEIKPLEVLSFDERNQVRITPKILEKLKDGDGAFITSAGMPGVSDPGSYLVRACREAGIEIIPVPGPSALTTAISASGFGGHFLFVGFLPKKKNQLEKMFLESSRLEQNLVFYESTHRLVKTLEILNEKFPDTLLFVGKEMTKKFEKYLVKTAGEILEIINNDKKFVRGEFTIIVNFRH